MALGMCNHSCNQMVIQSLGVRCFQCVCCTRSSNSGTTLHGGDGGGKALLSPFRACLHDGGGPQTGEVTPLGEAKK